MISPKIPIPEERKADTGVVGRFKVSDDEYRIQLDTSDSDTAYFKVVCETSQKEDVAIQLYHPEYFKDSRKLTKLEKEELIKFLNDKCRFDPRSTNYKMACLAWNGMNNEYSSYPEEDNFWKLDMPDYNLLEEDL